MTGKRAFCSAGRLMSILLLISPGVDAQQPLPHAGRRLVAIFAHADDERIAGPLLARYAREGHQVHLVIATDGSRGVTSHAGIPAGDSLAQVRAAEARCAARALGLPSPILLGLEDGALASFAALDSLEKEVRRVFAELRPDAIITFGPEGGSGHPDHRLVGAVVTEVVQEGGDGVPDALFYPSIPAEREIDAPGAAPTYRRVRAPFLTVRVPFAPEDLEATRRAYACYTSQYLPDRIDANIRYLGQGLGGEVHLRPWNGGARGSGVFGFE